MSLLLRTVEVEDIFISMSRRKLEYFKLTAREDLKKRRWRKGKLTDN